MGVACRKPLVIHDANAVAGLANRILAFGADRILLGFPEALRGRHADRVEWVGIPIRAEIAALPPPEKRFAGRSGPLRLLVIGGSLGATALNEQVPAALVLLSSDERPLVTHQAGERHIQALRATYAAAGGTGEGLPFLDDMAQRYAAADLVLSRSGGSTVAELAAAGIGAVLVPLPGAIADEQTHNARFLADAGGAVLLSESELSPQRLAEILRGFSRERLLAMAKAARGVARPDATELVAEACIAEARKQT